MMIEQKNEKWMKEAKIQCKKGAQFLNDFEEKYSKIIEKRTKEKIEKSRSEEIFINKYLDQSGIFDIADFIYKSRNGINKKEYSDITKEIAESVAKKIPATLNITVNTAFRYCKNDVDEYIEKKTSEQHHIERSKKVYEEVKFIIKQFKENEYDFSNSEDLYRILVIVNNINYALNKINKWCPGIVEEAIQELRTKIDYAQVCYLGVQYKEIVE